MRLARKLAQSNSALLASLRPGGTAGSGGSSNGQQGSPFPQESGGEESAGEEAQRGQRGQRARQGPVPAPAGSSGPSPGVSRQLALLGESHIGFGSAHYPDLNLSVVGGRPFSKGGKQWSDVAAFYRALYDVGSPQQSAARIAGGRRAGGGSAPRPWLRALDSSKPEGQLHGGSGRPAEVKGWLHPAAAAPALQLAVEPLQWLDHTSVPLPPALPPTPSPHADTVAAQPAGACCMLAAHNGPTGLGSARHDPCGVDWMAEEGDHGDPDLQVGVRVGGGGGRV